jgi:uncharacterized protein
MFRITTILAGLLILLTNISAIPEKPNPERWVNDYTGLFTAGQLQALEQKLKAFSNETTTQIAVVVVDDLEGEDKAMYAYEIGEKWGVGNAKFNNGIVVLLKPKTTASRGEVFIAPGYGLEGIIPDAIAKRIVDNEMISEFKKNNYYGGVDKAVDVLMSLSQKEYTAEEYRRETRSEEAVGGSVFGLMVFFFFLFSIISGVGRRRRSSLGRGGLSSWILLSMLGSEGRSHGGSFGNFSSGGGSFGGFGGGSFGGGGAGGSW